MQHLTLEAIARLLDEAPDTEAATHLDTCADCRQQLEDMRADRAALAALPMIEPPPDSWPSLEERLAEEHLITPHLAQRYWLSRVGRVAAAIVVFTVGLGTGLAWHGGTTHPPGLAENTDLPSIQAPAHPGSREAAEATLRQAESVYLTALTQYAEVADDNDSADPMTRLAALEGIVLTAREALGHAPADPVINGYLLTALAQREATLKQIATTTDRKWF